jgi:hypothetical protein
MAEMFQSFAGEKGESRLRMPKIRRFDLNSILATLMTLIQAINMFSFEEKILLQCEK